MRSSATPGPPLFGPENRFQHFRTLNGALWTLSGRFEGVVHTLGETSYFGTVHNPGLGTRSPLSVLSEVELEERGREGKELRAAIALATGRTSMPAIFVGGRSLGGSTHSRNPPQTTKGYCPLNKTIANLILYRKLFYSFYSYVKIQSSGKNPGLL